MLFPHLDQRQGQHQHQHQQARQVLHLDQAVLAAYAIP
jgi:hypothetical protein